MNDREYQELLDRLRKVPAVPFDPTATITDRHGKEWTWPEFRDWWLSLNEEK